MPTETKVSEIMARDVFTVSVDETLHKVDEIMKQECIKHVPVVEGKRYIGLITERSVMEYTLRQLYEYNDSYGEEAYNKLLDYRNLISKQDHIVFPEDSVSKAIKLMAKYRLDCLPVLDWEKNLVGLITSSDIMLFMHNYIEDMEAK